MNKNTAIDDCLKKIPERFELVVLASQRARMLYMGSASPLKDEDKKTSKIEVALEEIACDLCTRTSILQSFNSPIEVFDESEEYSSDFEIKDIKEGVSYDDFNIDEEKFD